MHFDGFNFCLEGLCHPAFKCHVEDSMKSSKILIDIDDFQCNSCLADKKFIPRSDHGSDGVLNIIWKLR